MKLLLGVLTLWWWSGARLQADQWSQCVVEMELPQMRTTILGVVPAQIHAVVTIGAHGQARSVEVSPNTRVFEVEISDYLRDRTRYSSACEGQKLTFTFLYEVEGPETEILTSRTFFRSPNQFVIRSHPQKPILDSRPKSH